MLDRARFFARIRNSLYAGRLSAAKVSGVMAILDAAEALVPPLNDGALAYVLATAFHETAGTLQPVRETLSTSDEAAIRALDRAYAAGRLPQVTQPYWRRDREGKSWLGRGFVQLTHRRNYAAISPYVGVDLVERPERALELATAAAILLQGMRHGVFTGRRLDDYFCAGRADFAGARAIINGKDRALRVAQHARAFYAALSAARIEPATTEC